jgi:hypothetical protein
VLGVHLDGRRLKANEVRVYVVHGPPSNRKRPYGAWGRKIAQRAMRIRTVVQPLFSL